METQKKIKKIKQLTPNKKNVMDKENLNYYFKFFKMKVKVETTDEHLRCPNEIENIGQKNQRLFHG